MDNNHRPSRLHQRRLRHRLRKAEKKAATTIILSDDDFSEHEIVSHNDPIVTRTVRESDSKEKAVKSKTKVFSLIKHFLFLYIYALYKDQTVI